MQNEQKRIDELSNVRHQIIAGDYAPAKEGMIMLGALEGSEIATALATKRQAIELDSQNSVKESMSQMKEADVPHERMRNVLLNRMLYEDPVREARELFIFMVELYREHALIPAGTSV